MKIDLSAVCDLPTALIQTGRNGDSDIIWSEPFEAQLYLQKDRKGLVCVIAIVNQNFAEFDPRNELNSNEENHYIVEDYHLKILSIVDNNPTLQRKTINSPR